MQSFRFNQVDVFANRPYFGNPLAVVAGAEGVSEEQMLQLARWTNLSETAFLLPPQNERASYRVRIFTPECELPFAGHPSVGAAYCALRSGLVDAEAERLVQECDAGLLEVVVEQGDEPIPFVQSPQPEVTELDASVATRAAACIGRDLDGPVPLLVDVGPRWLVVPLGTEEAVHALKPDMQQLARFSGELEITGITAFGMAPSRGGGHQIYVRSFAPILNVPEDPVCGSGNASVAAFILHAGLLDRVGGDYIARQGHELHRDGAVHVRMDPESGGVAIGGRVVPCIEGTIQL
ncbi:MAG: PhzF family phenazine biosynthesis protein [Synergistales bacterium]|nr:PhzF family phenazine biosynthesis protein [Synergistales bacterium]